MVRRGSTVRVRQRALQKRRTSALSRSDQLAPRPTRVGYGALYGAFASTTLSGGGNVEAIYAKRISRGIAVRRWFDQAQAHSHPRGAALHRRSSPVEARRTRRATVGNRDRGIERRQLLGPILRRSNPAVSRLGVMSVRSGAHAVHFAAWIMLCSAGGTSCLAPTADEALRHPGRLRSNGCLQTESGAEDALVIRCIQRVSSGC
jgi:hypothetical protein